MSSDEVRQALARGYCTKENETKELDSTLINAMAEEVMNLCQSPELREIVVGEQWISVKERLPSEMAFYICMMDEEPEHGTRIDIVFYAIRGYGSMAVKETGWAVPVLHGWANNKVTHWMPLPQPPITERKEK